MLRSVRWLCSLDVMELTPDLVADLGRSYPFEQRQLIRPSFLLPYCYPRSTKSITLQELRLYFDKPIEEAAKAIGICSTLLKKICRRYNIKRWPYRQVMNAAHTHFLSLGHS